MKSLVETALDEVYSLSLSIKASLQNSAGEELGSKVWPYTGQTETDSRIMVDRPGTVNLILVTAYTTDQPNLVWYEQRIQHLPVFVTRSDQIALTVSFDAEAQVFFRKLAQEKEEPARSLWDCLRTDE